MAQLAIFDIFYQSEMYPHMDAVSPFLQADEHEVIAHSTTTREAALAIVAMKNGDIPKRPDIVILGGRLDDDRSYVHNPATITERVEVPVRRLFGGHKQAIRRVTTTLLPVPEQVKNLHAPLLPATHNSPIKPEQVPSFANWMDIHFSASGRAAYVLSHLTRILLGNEVGIIGISSYNEMGGLPINAHIERGIGASDELRGAIQRLLNQP